MQGIPLDKDPHSLSGGYKRRLALAIQLVNLVTAPAPVVFAYILLAALK